ncbi:MAG TPA: [protein-PII] uridylyltransferase [Acidimicrobiales bacterium]|nr:[protein-PII] uridylyltransferase [Acidimicrobiales bacterium]
MNPDERMLVVRNDPTVRGFEFCRAYTEAVDAWLTTLFHTAAGGATTDGLALVAVGGYGRRELCAGSDLDLMLLHRGGRRDRTDVHKVAEKLWYPIWDRGLKLGHAVRTVKEAVALAGSDLNTATSQLDTRLLAGDADLAGELARRAGDQWRATGSRWLAALKQSVEERHDKAGEVAFLLEPDLKEGRGGLRDVHALHWAGLARRILFAGDDAALHAAHGVVLEVRIELQRRTGKGSDRLLLQEQDSVAEALGDDDANALMARLSAAARTIAWTSDEAWERIGSSLKGPRGRVAAADRPVAPGLVLREGKVELAAGADPANDPGLVLRAAAAAAQAATSLGRHSLDRLAAEAPEDLSGAWTEESRADLVALLGAGRPAIGILEALDQLGLLVRLLPEWAAVRCRPQRNAYHRFTVDRHLCEAAAGAAEHAGAVDRPDLLLVGTWLHDIGKGFTGVRGDDHTVAGEAVIAEIATRMGFPPADVDVLVAMVRHHLLLPDVATRRDLDDPSTIEAVAQQVGDRRLLGLLHFLTVADSQATGPAAWSPWKAGLVDELVYRVDWHMSGNETHATHEFPGPTHLAVLDRGRAERRLVLDAHRFEATVVAPDRPGLFRHVAGILALHGLDVLAARAWSSDDGWAIEHFHVEPAFGKDPNWPAVEADIVKALAGGVPFEARLADRARQYAGRTGVLAATPARTQITVDTEASATATVVEVRAPDRIGTLYRITRVLADLGLDIRSAKVSTVGHEVVDSFYVVEADGSKVTDDDRITTIEGALQVVLSGMEVAV